MTIPAVPVPPAPVQPASAPINVAKKDVQWHYDLSTLFYRLLWGPHIHHGLWNPGHFDESPNIAQVRLTETLAKSAGIVSGETVIDIGCGMGGSTIWLAKHGCTATGVTLSPFQRRWAANSAAWHGVSRKTTFLRADAEAVEFPAGSADVVWSIECTEHLFDKPRFFQRAGEWLKPGGRFAICAWLAGPEPRSPEHQKQVADVCQGMVCPSLGTANDYKAWFDAAGLDTVEEFDWTERVAQTWEICLKRVNRTGVRYLAHLIDKNSVEFIKAFPMILDAYRSGAMRYGAFIARKRGG
ncbi:MAG TPA: methyltransferase domain-containing protein [Pirellulales bacterium]